MGNFRYLRIKIVFSKTVKFFPISFEYINIPKRRNKHANREDNPRTIGRKPLCCDDRLEELCRRGKEPQLQSRQERKQGYTCPYHPELQGSLRHGVPEHSGDEGEDRCRVQRCILRFIAGTLHAAHRHVYAVLRIGEYENIHHKICSHYGNFRTRGRV